MALSESSIPNDKQRIMAWHPFLSRPRFLRLYSPVVPLYRFTSCRNISLIIGHKTLGRSSVDRLRPSVSVVVVGCGVQLLQLVAARRIPRRPRSRSPLPIYLVLVMQSRRDSISVPVPDGRPAVRRARVMLRLPASRALPLPRPYGHPSGTLRLQ